MSKNKLRVWWIPQVPMEPFHVNASSLQECVLLLDVLAKYDMFQFENNIKPDYCNAGGVEQWSDDTKEWDDWCDEETGEDDPLIFLRSNQNGGQP